jgi:hypothetical protein
MIKFFRHIRQRLLSESKFSKYLLYALGEIILVVIGILIAVGINSRYNEAQNEQKIKAILTQVQQELLTDIPVARDINDLYIHKDSLSRRIMNDSITVEDFKKDMFSVLINMQYVSFSNKKGGYERLMQNLENLPVRYSCILPDLNELYVEIQNNIDDGNTIIKNIVMSSTNDSWSKEPMAMDYLMGKYPEAAAEYFVNHPFLKNKTGRYINSLRNITAASNDYRIASISLYEKIDSLLGNKGQEHSVLLTVFPDDERMEPFVGDYVLVGGTHNRNLVNEFSVTIEDGHVLIHDWSVRLRELYWQSEGYFFEKGDKGIYQFYTKANGQHTLEWSNGFVNLLFVLKKDL